MNTDTLNTKEKCAMLTDDNKKELFSKGMMFRNAAFETISKFQSVYNLESGVLVAAICIALIEHIHYMCKSDSSEQDILMYQELADHLFQKGANTSKGWMAPYSQRKKKDTMSEDQLTDMLKKFFDGGQSGKPN